MSHNAKNEEQPGLWDNSGKPRGGEGRAARRTPPLLPAHRPAKPGHLILD